MANIVSIRAARILGALVGVLGAAALTLGARLPFANPGAARAPGSFTVVELDAWEEGALSQSIRR